jgi:hypothetical protein
LSIASFFDIHEKVGVVAAGDFVPLVARWTTMLL